MSIQYKIAKFIHSYFPFLVPFTRTRTFPDKTLCRFKQALENNDRLLEALPKLSASTVMKGRRCLRLAESDYLRRSFRIGVKYFEERRR